ncbi:MAG: PAS domain S-box protein [Candidatus Bipolaricaulis sp.]|nr:PAS domain S-box protein [Candidatus Bipolaricaulis sp.]
MPWRRSRKKGERPSRRPPGKDSAATDLSLQTLFGMAEEGILVADPATRRFVSANPAICLMLGFSAEELCTMGVEDIHPTESLESALSSFETLARGKKSLAPAVPCLRKDGSVLYADITSKPAVMTGRAYAVGFFTDVTERVRTESALAASEERHREMFEYMGTCVAVFEARSSGEDFVYVDINGAAERVGAVRREDVVGKSVLAVFPGIKEFGLFDAFQRVWRTGTPEHLPVAEYRDERICGWLQNYVYKLPTGEIVAVYEDVTEQKKAEERLEELMQAEREQRLLAEAFAGVTLGLAACRTLNEVLSEILRQAQKIVPYTSANIMLAMGGVLRTALARGYESHGGGDMVQALTLPVNAFPLNAEVVGKKSAIVVEDSRTDPRWVPLEETAWIRSHLAVPILSRDRLLGILRVDGDQPGRFTDEDARRLEPLASAAAVALENAQLYEEAQRELDVRRKTEKALRESELKYRQVVENAGEAIFIAQDGYVRLANAATARLLECPAEEIASRPFPEFIHPEDRAMIAERHKRRLAGEEFPSGYEFRFVTGQGTVRWGRLNATRVEWQGQPATLNVVSDITERKQTEEALRDSAQRLRTLAARLAEAQEVERRRISRELHDQVGQTLTALGMRLDRLSGDLREESGAGRAALDAASALLDESIRSVRTVMTNLRPSILDDYGISAALSSYQSWFQCPDSLVVTVDAPITEPRLPSDVATALFRIAQEALTNVVKHAQASAVTVRLREQDGVVRLEIEDDGVGLAADPAGAGDPHWGLEIMRERAEAVGGRLTINSSSSRGTSVIVEVPQR